MLLYLKIKQDPVYESEKKHAVKLLLDLMTPQVLSTVLLSNARSSSSSAAAKRGAAPHYATRIVEGSRSWTCTRILVAPSVAR